MKVNLTARAARWSAAHWKTATLAWVAFVVLAVGAGTVAGKVGLKDSEQSTGEAARAESILENAGFKQPAGESVRLTMTEAHSWDVPDDLLSGGRAGWPAILSSLKSVLETGKPLSLKMEPPKEMMAAMERLKKG